MKPLPIFLATLLVAVPTFAGPRTSANYTVLTDTTGTGGKRTTSAAYTNTGSAGGIACTSTVAAPAETAKAGFIAQLTEPTGLTLTAASLTVNETATDPLGAWLALDDATFLAIPSASVAWSATGPFTIASSGLGTAGVVFQNTSATAQGIYLGQTGTLGLTVLDTIADNFGTYAADGLGDDWQVQYFGENNPLAAPAVDADADGNNNLFEFTAGLVPTSNGSRFAMRVDPAPASAIKKLIVFSPIVAGRTYTVEFRTSLTSGNWAPLTTFTQSDAGNERTVTDTAGGGAQKFYRVNVSKP